MKLAVPSHSPSSVSSVRPFSERWRAGWLTAWALLVGALVALPVLAVISHVLSTGTSDTWAHLSSTVLPDYLWSTLWLCLGVGLGTASMGVGAAWLVTRYNFPLRGMLEWALVLPLAVPGYVMAYTYTDLLQFVGPVQTALREAFDWRRGDYWFPDVRSLGGAVLLFSFVLYPYVYMLARTAFLERAGGMLEVGRSLGLGPWGSFWRVSLPLARPAIAGGVALALMETLADFGVSSYFGIQTFTAGIYKAWLSMDNRIAAAQLATVLLAVVVVLLQLEQRAQKRMRFNQGRGSRQGSAEAQPVQLHGMRRVLAWTVCSLPVLLGFVLPVLIMLRAFMGETTEMPWERFGQWAWTSLRLGAITAVLAVGVALALAFSVRTRADRISQGAIQLVGLGYAIPGAVVVVGLLLPVGWIQQTWPASSAGAWITATSLGLVWAYLVRFCAVALQSVQSGYARIPASLDDSARMLGVTGWGLMRRVHAPLLQRTTIAAALLVFVDVMKELPATMVLRPFNSDTLAVVAYQLARDERLGEAALPSLALVLVGLIPVILLSRTLRQAKP